MAKLRPFHLAVALALAAGCSGTIGDLPVDDTTGIAPGPGEAVPGGASATASCQGAAPSTDPMRRLTDFEYERTLRDLFSGYDIGTPGQEVPGDVVGREDFFDNVATSQGLSAAHVDAYARIATRIAALVTSDAKFTGCDPSSGSDACFRTFITSFVARAYRRPPSADEIDRITATYAKVKVDLGFAGGEQAAIERVLQSPQFLYRLETLASGESGRRTKLTTYELASRLSYLMWGTIPDRSLMVAAADGSLDDPTVLSSQTARLFADPRAQGSFGHLFDQWFDLPSVENENKDMAMFPKFSADIAKLMAAESRAFFDDLTFGPDASSKSGTAALFASSFTFVNASLAAYYGLPEKVSGDAFQRVTLDPARAAGILTQGAFTSLRATDKTTRPVKRGLFVRTRVLCDALPPPPNGVPPAPMFTGKETARQLLAKHRASASCSGCHELMDPIGLGLENFDAAGAYREHDFDGMPVDASGEVLSADDATGSFVGAAELGAKLGASSKVRACMATQLFRFAFGRDADSGDACAIDTLGQTLATRGLKQLVLDLVASDAFRFRTN